MIINQRFLNKQHAYKIFLIKYKANKFSKKITKRSYPYINEIITNIIYCKKDHLERKKENAHITNNSLFFIFKKIIKNNNTLPAYIHFYFLNFFINKYIQFLLGFDHFKIINMKKNLNINNISHYFLNIFLNNILLNNTFDKNIRNITLLPLSTLKWIKNNNKNIRLTQFETPAIYTPLFKKIKNHIKRRNVLFPYLLLDHVQKNIPNALWSFDQNKNIYLQQRTLSVNFTASKNIQKKNINALLWRLRKFSIKDYKTSKFFIDLLLKLEDKIIIIGKKKPQLLLFYNFLKYITNKTVLRNSSLKYFIKKKRKYNLLQKKLTNFVKKIRQIITKKAWIRTNYTKKKTSNVTLLGRKAPHKFSKKFLLKYFNEINHFTPFIYKKVIQKIKKLPKCNKKKAFKPNKILQIQQKIINEKHFQNKIVLRRKKHRRVKKHVLPVYIYRNIYKKKKKEYIQKRLRKKYKALKHFNKYIKQTTALNKLNKSSILFKLYLLIKKYKKLNKPYKKIIKSYYKRNFFWFFKTKYKIKNKTPKKNTKKKVIKAKNIISKKKGGNNWKRFGNKNKKYLELKRYRKLPLHQRIFERFLTNFDKKKDFLAYKKRRVFPKKKWKNRALLNYAFYTRYNYIIPIKRKLYKKKGFKLKKKAKSKNKYQALPIFFKKFHYESYKFLFTNNKKKYIKRKKKRRLLVQINKIRDIKYTKIDAIKINEQKKIYKRYCNIYRKTNLITYNRRQNFHFNWFMKKKQRRINFHKKNSHFYRRKRRKKPIISKKNVIENIFHYTTPRHNQIILKEFLNQNVHICYINALTFVKMGFNLNQVEIKKQNPFKTKISPRKFFKKIESKIMRKFKHVVIYLADIVRIMYISLFLNKPAFIAKYLSFQLKVLPRNKKETQFVRFIFRMIKMFSIEHTFIIGSRIKIKGRINRWRRSKHMIGEQGIMPLQTVDNRINYATAQMVNKKGAVGLHIWLWYNPLHKYLLKNTFHHYFLYSRKRHAKKHLYKKGKRKFKNFKLKIQKHRIIWNKKKKQKVNKKLTKW